MSYRIRDHLSSRRKKLPALPDEDGDPPPSGWPYGFRLTLLVIYRGAIKWSNVLGSPGSNPDGVLAMVSKQSFSTRLGSQEDGPVQVWGQSIAQAALSMN